jgi:predicted pyridoxine 5'-phosphate oxidase superfamily flavin-nucleotide-binding protein
MLTEQVKKYIDSCVLCWLATCDLDLMPNVSPKEMFTYLDDTTLLIAHLASPNSINNIKVNPNVCVSFVDVFIQKGYKIKGTATVIEKTDSAFPAKVKPLTDLFTDQFPILSVIEITLSKVETIQAPSYFLFPETTTEASQIAGALATYGVRAL